MKLHTQCRADGWDVLGLHVIKLALLAVFAVSVTLQKTTSVTLHTSYSLQLGKINNQVPFDSFYKISGWTSNKATQLS